MSRDTACFFAKAISPVRARLAALVPWICNNVSFQPCLAYFKACATLSPLTKIFPSSMTAGPRLGYAISGGITAQVSSATGRQTLSLVPEVSGSRRSGKSSFYVSGVLAAAQPHELHQSSTMGCISGGNLHGLVDLRSKFNVHSPIDRTFVEAEPFGKCIKYSKSP